MLQAFVPSTGDSWAAMLAALADDPAAALTLATRVGDVTARLTQRGVRTEDRHPARAAPWRRPRRGAHRPSTTGQAVSAVSGDDHERRSGRPASPPFADTFGSAVDEARVTRSRRLSLGQLLRGRDGG